MPYSTYRSIVAQIIMIYYYDYYLTRVLNSDSHYHSNFHLSRLPPKYSNQISLKLSCEIAGSFEIWTNFLIFVLFLKFHTNIKWNIRTKCSKFILVPKCVDFQNNQLHELLGFLASEFPVEKCKICLIIINIGNPRTVVTNELKIGQMFLFYDIDVRRCQPKME